MALFRIIYRDPETKELKEIEQEFFDSADEFYSIKAIEWAEDYGYTLADKGYYSVQEIK